MEGGLFKSWQNCPMKQSKKGVKVTCVMEEEKDEQLNPEELAMIANHSFMRRMSQAKPTSKQELQPLLQSHHPPLRQSPLPQWWIVEVDESKLSSSWLESWLCSNADNTDPHTRPSTLKSYYLLLNLANRQITLRSLESPHLQYHINLDTTLVECSTAEMGSPLERELISLSAGGMTFDIYMTENIVSYPLCEKVSLPNKQQYAEKRKTHLQQMLQHHIGHSRGCQLGLTSPILHPCASEEQFVQHCQTGDIVLFRDNHTMAKVQRALTNSSYDHVGIVVRKQRYGVCIFDSSSNVGVSLVMWMQMMKYKWYENIEKISWRRLEVVKDEGVQEKVQLFVRENLEKEFSLSIPKLLRFKSAMEHEQKTSYFCSELVAKLYKFLGILPVDVSSTQYWPKHFSDAYGLSLQGASLHPERQLIFDESLMRLNYPS